VTVRSLSVEKPDRSGERIENVSAGGVAFLTGDVEREPSDLPVTYRWELPEGAGEITGSEQDPSGVYHAPQKVDTATVITVSLVVLSDGKEIARKTIPLQIVPQSTAQTVAAQPSPDHQQVPAHGGGQVNTTSPPQISALGGESIVISHPSDGERVDNVITVAGRVTNLNPAEQLVLLARPKPDDPSQSWWVRSRPAILSNGAWTSSPVFIGLPDDPTGTPFMICVVITSPEPTLQRGQQLSQPPAGPSSCINLARR
jgi:hypothetical protein